MFSQVSVSSRGGGVGVRVDISGPMSFPGDEYVQGVGTHSPKHRTSGWYTASSGHRIQRDMVGKQAVIILLEYLHVIA